MILLLLIDFARSENCYDCYKTSIDGVTSGMDRYNSVGKWKKSTLRRDTLPAILICFLDQFSLLFLLDPKNLTPARVLGQKWPVGVNFRTLPVATGLGANKPQWFQKWYFCKPPKVLKCIFVTIILPLGVKFVIFDLFFLVFSILGIELNKVNFDNKKSWVALIGVTFGHFGRFLEMGNHNSLFAKRSTQVDL